MSVLEVVKVLVMIDCHDSIYRKKLDKEAITHRFFKVIIETNGCFWTEEGDLTQTPIRVA